MKKIFLSLLIFALPISVVAQESGSSSGKKAAMSNIDVQSGKMNFPFPDSDIIKSFKGLADVDEIFQPEKEWITKTDLDPKYNFLINGFPEPAGDINGDGYDDYVVTGTARDERTSFSGDNIGKTAVYFGGGCKSGS